MPSSHRPSGSDSHALLHVLILQLLLSLSACTTPQPRAKEPTIPPPPAPAECLKSAFQAFAPGLSGLPTNYRQLTPDARARVLLRNKADDGDSYRLLRAQALRCAPVH